MTKEKQEKKVGDEVFLKKVPGRGTIRLKVMEAALHDHQGKRRWYLKLQEIGSTELYSKGDWFSQKKVGLAQRAPTVASQS